MNYARQLVKGVDEAVYKEYTDFQISMIDIRKSLRTCQNEYIRVVHYRVFTNQCTIFFIQVSSSSVYETLYEIVPVYNELLRN